MLMLFVPILPAVSSVSAITVGKGMVWIAFNRAGIDLHQMDLNKAVLNQLAPNTALITPWLITGEKNLIKSSDMAGMFG